jgi:hypothetical protein
VLISFLKWINKSFGLILYLQQSIVFEFMMKIVFFKSCHLKQVCRYQQINLNLEAACTELDRVEVRESPSARRRTGAAPPSCFGGGFAVCIYRKRRDLVRENLPHSSTKRGWLRQNHYVTALPSSNSRMNPWRPRALTSRRGKINRHYFIIFARRTVVVGQLNENRSRRSSRFTRLLNSKNRLRFGMADPVWGFIR